MLAVISCVILNAICIFAEHLHEQALFLKVAAYLDPSTLPSHNSHKVTSDEDCAVWCLQTEGCKSYSVEISTKMCFLNDYLLDETNTPSGFNHFNFKLALDNIRCLNEGVLNHTTSTCRCFSGYVGDRCERLMQDCSEGFQSGHYNGMEDVFWIHPMTSSAPIRVICKMKWGGKTFILFQKANNPYVNFTRDWNDYKIGFGNLENDSNFFIGNDIIHLITSNRKQNLMIDAQFGSSYRQFTHTGVKVASEKEKYRLTYESKFCHVDHPLGDCFPGNNIPFSTIDQDNDAVPGNSCALTHMSGWWFDNCGPCNPTGRIHDNTETGLKGGPTSLFIAGANNLAVQCLSIYLYV